MKKLLIVLSVVVLLSSCGQNQKSCESTCKDSTKVECVVDSLNTECINDTVKVDSTVVK